MRISSWLCESRKSCGHGPSSLLKSVGGDADQHIWRPVRQLNSALNLGLDRNGMLRIILISTSLLGEYSFRDDVPWVSGLESQYLWLASRSYRCPLRSAACLSQQSTIVWDLHRQYHSHLQWCGMMTTLFISYPAVQSESLWRSI